VCKTPSDTVGLTGGSRLCPPEPDPRSNRAPQDDPLLLYLVHCTWMSSQPNSARSQAERRLGIHDEDARNSAPLVPHDLRPEEETTT
jgi:hypothetical protein